MGEKMDHLNRVVERVLDLARGTEPHFSSVNVNLLIEDLALLTRHKLRQQGVNLERELATDLPLLPADATQLEQAFLNIIGYQPQSTP